ncbi:MAG: hypothetical protein AAGD11_06090 [Planctomycetota bacterium]
MEKLLHELDPLVVSTVVMPVALLAAAWALRMACAVCSVKVPDLMTAAAVVVVIMAANFGLRLGLGYHEMSLNLGSQLLLVLLISALVVSFSVRTSIASALAVTITQVFLCGALYVGVTEFGRALL